MSGVVGQSSHRALARKLHANGVIQNSAGSDREAVATPGIDGIAMELQGSSTDRPDHPETTLVHAVDTSGMRPRFVELTSEFQFIGYVPRVAARASPYPGLFCMTPLASERSHATAVTPFNLTCMRSGGLWPPGQQVTRSRDPSGPARGTRNGTVRQSSHRVPHAGSSVALTHVVQYRAKAL
jgi:hypothetical protein